MFPRPRGGPLETVRRAAQEAVVSLSVAEMLSLGGSCLPAAALVEGIPATTIDEQPVLWASASGAGSTPSLQELCQVAKIVMR